MMQQNGGACRERHILRRMCDNCSPSLSWAWAVERCGSALFCRSKPISSKSFIFMVSKPFRACPVGAPGELSEEEVIWGIAVAERRRTRPAVCLPKIIVARQAQGIGRINHASVLVFREMREDASL